jgi:hypothetical protein
LFPEANLKSDNKETVIYFRSRDVINNCRLTLTVDGGKVFEKKYAFLRPPEMERLMLNFNNFNLNKSSNVKFEIEEGTA